MVLLQQMDMDVLMWLQENLRQEGLDQVFSFFTRLGNNGELWIALLVVLFIIPPFRRMALTAAVSLISSALLVEFVIKPLVARVRPYVTVKGLFSLVGPERSYSFPSGHSATAFAVAYVLARMLPVKYGAPILLLAALMAFSRLYVGVHYPTDVLVGVMVGVLVGETCYQIQKALNRSQVKE